VDTIFYWLIDKGSDMIKRPTFEDFKKEALKDPEVRAEYDKLESEFALLEKLIKARNKARSIERRSSKSSSQKL
jgi:hypothetical protein